MNSKKKILIVEDEAIHAMYLQIMLSSKGYEISGLAASAEEVMDSIHKDCPDLALMDITLRNFTDGIELSHTIRKQYDFPIIFISGYDDPETKAKIKLIDNAYKMTKPLDEFELLQLIEKILASR